MKIQQDVLIYALSLAMAKWSQMEAAQGYTSDSAALSSLRDALDAVKRGEELEIVRAS